MTKPDKKFNLKAFVSLMIVLVLSLALAFSTACAKKTTSKNSTSDDSSKEEEEKPTDKQTLPNGDFEWYTDDVSASSPYSTGIKWSRYLGGDSPNKAPSSEGRYGVIDTNKYEDLDDKYKPEDKSNPGTPTIAEGTKYLDENVKKDGKKILVIQNKYKTTGTAQYLSPSKSVSIPAGSVGVFSVYVKTKDVTAPNSDTTGAYIRLTGTVGSSIDPVYIENIDTKGAWVRYIVTIEPSVTATTSISFALGLGKGNEKNMSGYAEGFAYFDNASFVVVKKSEAPASADARLDYTSASGTYVADEKNAIAEGVTERTIDVNFADTYVSKTVNGTGDYNEIRTDKTNGVSNKVMKAGDANASDDFKVGYGNATLKLDGKDEEVTNAVYMVFPKTGKDGKAVFGSSYSYTIDSVGTDALSVKGADYTKDENSVTYYRLSFLAKVKTAASSQSGASVVVMDNGKESSSGKFSYFTTAEEDGKYNDGYVRYTLYICTKYESDMNFSVKFSFGPTDNTDDPRTLPTGYAIFKDFTFDMLDGDKVYNEATSTNVVKLSLIGANLEDYTKDDDTKEKDSYNITVSDIDAKTVLPRQAVNVYDSNASVKILTEQDGNQIGIVNSQYRADYPVSYLGAAGILKDLEEKIQGDNKHVQALMVANNKGNAETVLYTTEKTITSNGSAEFAIKVRVDEGQTTANIRLFKIATLESGEEDGNLSLNIKNGESAKDYVASVKVTNNNAAGLDGWTTIRFFVKAGDDAMKLRLEFGVSGGAALFDLVSDSKSVTTEDELKNAFNDYKFDGKGVEARTGYYYKNEEDVGKENKRLKDKDGKVRTIELDAETLYAYALPKTVTADVTDENATVRLYRFDVKDYVIETADDGADDDDSDDSDNTPAKTNTESGKVAWLNIVSIIIAAVIVVVLLAIVVKKFVDDRKRKKAKTQSYYSGYDQTSAHENGSRYSVRNAKKGPKSSDAKKSTVTVQAPDAEDEATEYDYGDGETEDKNDGDDE